MTRARDARTVDGACAGPGRVPSAAARVARAGAGAVVVVVIMFLGSLVLWLGTPLFWLWVGSQIQGAGVSLGTALAAMFAGAIATVVVLATVLAKLSGAYRANRRTVAGEDPGDAILERVLVISAAVALAAFAIWFLLLAGTSPVPVGIQL